MKAIHHNLNALHQPHVLFSLYRWGAWVAALALLWWNAGLSLPGPTLLWLALLSGSMTLLLTGLVRPYVTTVERRPLLLTLDLCAGLALVWASGGMLWPFMPLALAALVLPALLWPWRSALLVAGLFAAGDIALLLGNGSPSLGTLLLRALLPFAFVIACVGLQRLLAALPGHVAARPVLPRVPDGLIANALQPGFNRLSASLSIPPRLREAPGDGSERLFGNSAGRSTFTASLAPAPRSATPRPTTEEAAVPAVPTTWHNQPFPADLPLEHALRQLVAEHRQAESAATTLMLHQVGDVQPVSFAAQRTLFRLTQEALHNIEQHAGAHAAVLTLRYDQANLTLTITDDGVGLLDGTHEPPGFRALRALRYRLAELDGVLTVYEGEPGGVVVQATVPLSHH